MAKPTPAWLTALGGKPLPETIEADGQRYALAKVFKNDFFAVTARYDRVPGDGPAVGGEASVLLKVGREARMFGLPLAWVGRMLTRREVAFLKRLEGVEGVPRFMAWWGRTGLIRQFVPGHALRKGEAVADEFHSRLREVVAAMHARDVAYVDLEKCENVLVGDDGRPHLFDFQISWFVPRAWGGRTPPAMWLLRRFQRADLYHLQKLQRRTRPDQLSPEDLAASYRRPWYIKLHRLVADPLRAVRRKILGRLAPEKRHGERGRLDDHESVSSVRKA